MKYILISFIALIGLSVRAIEPPSPGEIEQLRQSGKLMERLSFAEKLGNHKMRPDVAQRAMAKMQNLARAQAGIEPTPLPGRIGMPTTGTNKILIVLVDFNDFPHVNESSLIESKILGDGNPNEYPQESLRNYYRRSSYDQLHLEGNVLGWYRAQHERDYYTTTYPNDNDANRAIIDEVVRSFDDTHDFSQYDNDGDGFVDYLAVIWSGPDTGWSTFWWGYQWSLFNPITLDGVKIRDFSWQWESRPVGVPYEAQTIIHETGHALGLPDYYDYDDTVGPRGGLGGLDMMDGNMADHCSFSKFVLDWMTPTGITSGGGVVSLPALATTSNSVALMPTYDGTPFGEYFLVENRFRVLNDTGNPSDGILIWHIDAQPNATGTDFLYNNSFTDHKLIRLMEADGLEEIEFNGFADAGDYFNTGDEFSPDTIPNSRAYDGTETGVTVRSISSDSPLMTVDCSVGSFLQFTGYEVGGGNGNGLVDPNECVDLRLFLANKGLGIATGVSAELFCLTPGIIISQKSSSYPNLQPGETNFNTTPFRVSITPSFPCGSSIEFGLIIKMDQETRTNHFRVPTGRLGQPVEFKNNVSTNIPDGFLPGVSSTLNVTNFSGPIGKATVSLHIRHTYDFDLSIELIAPDGTIIPLSRNHGGSGDNYGIDCSPANRTVFDDDATNHIAQGISPFAGSFRPDSPLNVLRSKPGNGAWQLHISDQIFIDSGILECWSLNLFPAVCTDGGGECPGVDLALKMTAAPEPVVAGSNLVYIITVTNSGPDTAKSTIINQTLPSGATFVSAVASQGSVSHAGGVVTANLGNLNALSTAVVTVTIRPASGTVSSTASVGSNQPDFDLSNNSATVISHVLPPASDLAISILDSPDPVLVGGTITYTVSIVNNGPAPATGTVITNSFPLSVTILSATASQGTASTLNNGIVLCNLGTLPVGSNATVTITARPNVIGTLSVTATAASGLIDPLPGNNSASALTAVTPAADVGVSIVAQPVSVVVGSNLTYIVTVTNKGPTLATNIVVSDLIASTVNYVSATATQGIPSRSGNVLTWTLANLSSGGSATLTIVVSVPTTAIPSIENSASVSASQADPDLSNNSAGLTTLADFPRVVGYIVAAGATLTAESFSPPNGAIDFGETVTVDFRLQNTGNVGTTNAVATLLATGGVTSPSGPQSYGLLGVGELPTARSFTFTATSALTSNITATLQIQDTSTNLGTVSFVLALPKIATFSNATPIVISEHGIASPYPSSVTVSNVTGLVGNITVTLSGMSHTFPEDVDMLLVDPTGRKLLLMSDTLEGNGLTNATFTLDDHADSPLPDTDAIVSSSYQPADYEPGDSFPNAPTPPYGNAFSVFNGANPNGNWSLYVVDDNIGDEGEITGGWALSITTVSPLNKVADLAMTVADMSDPVLLGENVVYVFTITNNGPDLATGIGFTNTLPAGLTLVEATSSQGSVLINGGTVTANLGSLGVGTNAFVVVVTTPTVSGSITNTGSIGRSEIDLNTGNNVASAVTTVNRPNVDLITSISDSPDPAVIGSNITYVITITNAGPQTAYNVVVTDTLPSGVIFVSAIPSQGSANAPVGPNVSCNLGTVISGGTASVVIVGQAITIGNKTNNVTVSTSSNETAPGDNSVAAVTSVINPIPQIAAAGATLILEGNPANGSLDAGETVTVGLALVNTGSANTTNLGATLQGGVGVTALSPAQNYGALIAGGVSVSRTFTFKVNTNVSVAIVTLVLQDGGVSRGSVQYSFALPTTATGANTNSIVLPLSGAGAANPYPATINISGLSGLVSKVTATLSNINHSFPDDFDILLVSPTGQKVILMSDAGGGRALTNVTLTFDDSQSLLSDAGQIVSGTYAPTDYESGESLPTPAPAKPYANTLAALNGMNPNGAWSLYVLDDTTADGGNIADGWSLNITTVQTINPAAEVGISIGSVPATVTAGNSFVATINVVNNGPNQATDVVVSNVIPAGLTYVNGTATQGSVTSVGGSIVANLGNLNSGASASIALTLGATLAGPVTSQFDLMLAQTDLNQVNNTTQFRLNIFTFPKPQLSDVSVLTNKQFQFTLTGVPGTNYIIQASTNLVSWISVSTNVAAINGTFKFTDSNAPGSPHRFYRALRAP